MPRIQAPTVAEHRAQRRKALLDAARALMVETGEPPSIGQVGKRVGLARSSVYQYFESVEELLTAVAVDLFPSWLAGVYEHVAAAPTPAERVWGYVVAHVALFASPDLSVIKVVAKVIPPQHLHSPMRDYHLQLQVPLRQALADLQEPEPEAMATLIDSLIVEATHVQEMVDEAVEAEVTAQSLARLRRLIGGYLGLPPDR